MRAVIAGGGIGGLTAALSLHEVGIDVQVLESAREMRALGVGINLLPHATRELVELGLGDQLADVAIPTGKLAYFDRFGSPIWKSPAASPPATGGRSTRSIGVSSRCSCCERSRSAWASAPMYPIGSNGGSQAIVDGRVLAWHLARNRDDPAAGLAAYEDARRDTVNAIVVANRAMGPERVLAMVAHRAPNGFTHIDVFSAEELAEISSAYKRTAGFDAEELNARPSWST